MGGFKNISASRIFVKLIKRLEIPMKGPPPKAAKLMIP
jgi:hypothetical protein